MIKEICDECGEKVATLQIVGGNPVPTYNHLSKIAGNQGFSLCDACRKIDPKDWKNIEFDIQYLDSVRRSVGFAVLVL